MSGSQYYRKKISPSLRYNILRLHFFAGISEYCIHSSKIFPLGGQKEVISQEKRSFILSKTIVLDSKGFLPTLSFSISVFYNESTCLHLFSIFPYQFSNFRKQWKIWDSIPKKLSIFFESCQLYSNWAISTLFPPQIWMVLTVVL